jgi:hypothetical protein
MPTLDTSLLIDQFVNRDRYFSRVPGLAIENC